MSIFFVSSISIIHNNRKPVLWLQCTVSINAIIISPSIRLFWKWWDSQGQKLFDCHWKFCNTHPPEHLLSFEPLIHYQVSCDKLLTQYSSLKQHLLFQSLCGANKLTCCEFSYWEVHVARSWCLQQPAITCGKPAATWPLFPQTQKSYKNLDIKGFKEHSSYVSVPYFCCPTLHHILAFSTRFIMALNSTLPITTRF